MFDKEFFPTPVEVIEMMGFDSANKICLEPSSGKGDIIDYLFKHGAKSVLCVEKNKDLANISAAKGELIGNDWLEITADKISHVQLIVMNPPFSNADEHINHAFDIAPDGCEIFALCNWETISNVRGWGRNKLTEKIRNYGIATELGEVFKKAERTTGVNVGLVKLFKPITDSDSQFDGFFLDEDDEDRGSEGLIKFNEVRQVVNVYVNAVKAFDTIEQLVTKLNKDTNYIGMRNIAFTFQQDSEKHHLTTKEAYIKNLQKQSWNYIIDKFNLRKFTTSEMAKDINNFVEKQQKYPFTMKNIYHMMDMIIQTRGQQFQKALVLAVDQLTMHVKENRFGVEGWHTNSGHMINEKIIIPNMFERGWNNASYVEVWYRSHYKDRLDDLVKVLCLNEGVDYSFYNGYSESIENGIVKKHAKPTGISSLQINGSRHFNTSEWYEWGFFEFKAFYKGTMHLKFKDRKVWERLNRAYAETKGFNLPEKI